MCTAISRAVCYYFICESSRIHNVQQLLVGGVSIASTYDVHTYPRYVGKMCFGVEDSKVWMCRLSDVSVACVSVCSTCSINTNDSIRSDIRHVNACHLNSQHTFRCCRLKLKLTIASVVVDVVYCCSVHRSAFVVYGTLAAKSQTV